MCQIFEGEKTVWTMNSTPSIKRANYCSNSKKTKKGEIWERRFELIFVGLLSKMTLKSLLKMLLDCVYFNGN